MMEAKRQRLIETSSCDLEDGSTSKYEVKFTCCGFFNDPGLSDVKLSFNDGSLEFYLHRVILASRSEFFKSVFTGKGRKETSPSSVDLEIDDHFEKVLEPFLKFFYGFPVDISKENMWLYYFLAEQYMVDDLSKVCAAYLRENLGITKRKRGDTMALDPSNSFSVQEVVDVYEQFKNDHVKTLAASNLMARLDGMPPDLWLSLSKECVCAILNSETSVLSEKDLFLRAVAWLKQGGDLNLSSSQSIKPEVSLSSSQETLRTQAETVLSSIRYCHMSKPSDIMEAQMNPLVMSSPQLIALVASGCHYKFMKRELAPEEFAKLAEFKKKQYANRRYRKMDFQRSDTPVKSSPRPSESRVAESVVNDSS